MASLLLCKWICKNIKHEEYCYKLEGNTDVHLVPARPLPLGVECQMIFAQQIKSRTAVALFQEMPEVQTVLYNYTVLLF